MRIQAFFFRITKEKRKNEARNVALAFRLWTFPIRISIIYEHGLLIARFFCLPFFLFLCVFCIGLCDAPTTTLRGLVVLRSRVIVSPFPFLAEINRQLEVNGGHHSVFGSYFAFALCSLLFSRLHHESTIHPCSVSAAEATR